MVGIVVEEDIRIVTASAEEYFEVHMLCGGMASTARQSDDLPGFHLLSHFDEVLRLVAIERHQSVSVLNFDAVAVATVITCLDDFTVEGSKNVVVGSRLDVHSRVNMTATMVAIGADDVGSR